MERELADALAAIRDRVQNVIDESGRRVREMEDRLDLLEVRSNRPGAPSDPHDSPRGDLAEERRALASYARTGDESAFKRANLATNDDTAGGYIVMPAVSTRMTQRMHDQSPMLKLVRTEPVGTGDAFEEPTDLSDIGAEWVGERESRPETTSPTFGMIRAPLDEIYALVPITQRLLDDSSRDLGAYIERKFADKFARSIGAAVVSGNGVKKPKGFLTYDTDPGGDSTRAANKLQHVVSGAAALITADSIRDLYWSMRAPHRGNATWVMSSATAGVVDKLKTGDGQYLWRAGITANAPPTLLGRPVEFSEDMPSVAANTLPIAFGDWKEGYVVADRPGMRLLRDNLTSKPNVLFYAYRRTGGAVANSDAIKLLKVSV